MLTYLRRRIHELSSTDRLIDNRAALVATSLLRKLEQQPIPKHRLFNPIVSGDGLGGIRLHWKRNCGHVVVIVEHDGSTHAYKVDTGAEESSRVQSIALTPRTLNEALQWLINSEHMLIRSQKATPISRRVPSAFSGELPLVSVVVACYGALEFTKKLVASLRDNAGCQYELLLVDDCCPEKTYLWARAEGIPCLRHDTNWGLPRTLNHGAAMSRGQVLALWNSDMLVLPGGLRKLAEAAMVYGIAGQTGGFFAPGGHYVGQTGDQWQADYPEGYCLTVRRDVWDDVGGWDPIYWPTNCDDSDWALRARLRGHDFVLVPECVHHFGQGSTDTPGFNEVVQRNQVILRKRFAQYGLGERILVRRWGAAGDLIMATPAIRGLKAKWPLCRLHVQTHRDAGAVLDGLPYIDAVFGELPSGINYNRQINLNGAYEQLQTQGIWTHPTASFCRAAGVVDDKAGYDLKLFDEHIKFAEETFIKKPGVTYIAAVVRSACRPKSNWNLDGWLGLANSLPEGVQLVALDAERRPPVDVQEQRNPSAFYDHPKVVDLTGRTPSFHHAAAIIARCDAAVAVDTGLYHAAAALRVPVVGLIAGLPVGVREAANTSSVHLLGDFPPCRPCQDPGYCRRTDGSHCLDSVHPDSVLEAISSVVSLPIA